MIRINSIMSVHLYIRKEFQVPVRTRQYRKSCLRKITIHLTNNNYCISQSLNSSEEQINKV